MTKKQQARRREIVAQLAELSRNGWASAQPYDYQALERELRQIER
jgi:hypothetical protein